VSRVDQRVNLPMWYYIIARGWTPPYSGDLSSFSWFVVRVVARSWSAQPLFSHVRWRPDGTQRPPPAFGDVLRGYRQDAGLTQEDLAARAGLSTRAVSDLERGPNRQPRKHTIAALARALSLSPHDHKILEGAARRLDGRSATRPEPTPSSGTHIQHLPPQMTSFIGRDQDIAVVVTLLQNTTVRLLTLVGPGGVGKTRLALRVAETLLSAFPDGLYFVPLSILADPRLVVATIAQTLGISGSPTPQVALLAYLRHKHLLLVLDNVEHVLPAALDVAAILAECPHVTILATSRVMLRVRGERTYPVAPLPVPDMTHSPAREHLTQYAAVQLFIERAQAVEPSFVVTNANAPAIAEICQRLDGLPLAIELAAARVNVLRPQAMLARLGRRLEVLTDGPRDVPERQRTLRATIAWSDSLLAGEERWLFHRLAVFGGGWTLTAADVVLTDDNRANAINILDVLGSLVDKSLVRQKEGDDNELRFGFLETVHEYALDQLDSVPDVARLRSAHAAYYLGLAEAIEPELRGAEQGHRLRQFHDELGNIRLALRWFHDHGEREHGLRLAGALSRFWEMRAYLSEGRRWLETMLTGCDVAAPALRAKALRGLGVLVAAQGDMDRAIALVEESVALYGAVGDETGQADALGNLAWMRYIGPNPQAALPFFTQARDLCRTRGDSGGVSAALMGLGCLTLLRGEGARGRALPEESLVVAEEGGDRYNIGHALYNIGWASLVCGDETRAGTRYAESLTCFWGLGDARGVVMGLEGVAALVAPHRPLHSARLLVLQRRITRRAGRISRHAACGGVV